ncbi:MAG: hypothetical protein ICV72_06820 [Aldersonia sp.]|nr:hypothetical protein [Aldersonia sp.]
MSTRRKPRRAALIALVMVAALGCLALGWWQWTRYESAAGTAQNLGYALQWPLFAAFCVYAYRRFVQLEAEEQGEKPRPAAPQRELSPDLLPERPQARPADVDVAMAEYNRYLAELNARDRNDSANPRRLPDRSNQ